MALTEPLPLFHSWPLFDTAGRMELRRLLAIARTEETLEALLTRPDDSLALAGIGIWSCDLADNKLTWTSAVHDLFGLPRDEPVTRALALSCYEPRSRGAMEQLRAHAIRHQRGFTMDAMIRRPDGEERWMRLSAFPVLRDGRPVRLCGTKEDVTADYDGPDWRRI